MPKSLARSLSWMPVLVVSPGQTELSAKDAPDSRGAVKIVRKTKATWQRVGTAILQKDGSFAVQLDSIPVNGKLWIRPPKRGETLEGEE